jgi:predicted ArsR family transcriptional regulator
MKPNALGADLVLDALAKHLDLNRRTVQVMVLLEVYPLLSVAEISDILGVGEKTLRDRHLPRLENLHWVKSLPGDRWSMEAIKRKRVTVLYGMVEREVVLRLKKYERVQKEHDPSYTPTLGTMA